MFIHDVLVEYILGGGDTEIQDAKIMKYFEDLEKPNANGENHLERQFLVSILILLSDDLIPISLFDLESL